MRPVLVSQSVFSVALSGSGCRDGMEEGRWSESCQEAVSDGLVPGP
jgi:hypothetical protein